MPATERVVVMMEPREKARLNAVAAEANLTLSEYLRRAAAAYEFHASPEQLAELDMLFDEFDASMDRINQSIHQMSEAIRRATDPAEEAAARERIRAEILASGETWTFGDLVAVASR